MLYTSDGIGGFQTSLFAASNGAGVVAIADFNDDGKPDVAVLTYGEGIGTGNAVIVYAH